jgi:2-oxoisovalerate dehydrogenase E2 component (dihydrolipoyl transacylase)
MTERVFAMPDLGEGLEEGRVVSWLVHEGDRVELNQPLVEVETAKAVVEIPSPFAGRIATLHASDGVDVAVGAPLVTFAVQDHGSVADETEGSARGVPPPPTTSPRRTGSRPAATPPVRKLAKELGVDLSAVVGGGPEGRITEQDVRAFAGGDEAYDVAEVTAIRREAAARLTRVAAVPSVTTFRTVDCAALEGFRAEIGVSPLPVLIAALARTYPSHPLINASWFDREIRTYRGLHVGLAVDTPRGLAVPILRNADERGVDDLAGEIRRLAETAREGQLALEDVAGPATMGVSNTGSYGSEAGTPLLVPGTAVTLAFGVIAPRPLVVEGAVAARAAATISLTFDHRVLDGAEAGRALTDLVELLQSDERLRDLPR